MRCARVKGGGEDTFDAVDLLTTTPEGDRPTKGRISYVAPHSHLKKQYLQKQPATIGLELLVEYWARAVLRSDGNFSVLALNLSLILGSIEKLAVDSPYPVRRGIIHAVR